MYTFIESRNTNLNTSSKIDYYFCNKLHAKSKNLLLHLDIVGSPPLEPKTAHVPERGPWLTTALGFGSLLFLMNWVFGEVSLITRWTVKPYPDHGPEPYPWGSVVFLHLK